MWASFVCYVSPRSKSLHLLLPPHRDPGRCPKHAVHSAPESPDQVYPNPLTELSDFLQVVAKDDSPRFLVQPCKLNASTLVRFPVTQHLTKATKGRKGWGELLIWRDTVLQNRDGMVTILAREEMLYWKPHKTLPSDIRLPKGWELYPH